MTRIACVIIATERRRTQIDRVLHSALCQGFDDVIVVGDWARDVDEYPKWRSWGAEYIGVVPVTHTPIDALEKRDVGTAVTNADVLVYLCDDHILAPGFGAALRGVLDEPWDVLVPNRTTQILRHPLAVSSDDWHYVTLNNGEAEGYCGGHAGIFRRHVITAKPWSAHAHHRNWDALISHEQIARGARFVWSPRAELTVTDIEPQAQPWL